MSSNRRPASERDPQVQRGPWQMVARIAGRYPIQATLTVGAMLLSGLLEGVGIALLLPFLALALPDGSTGFAADGLATHIVAALEFLGLGTSLGALLLLVVVAVALKAAVSLGAMAQVAAASSRVAADMRLRVVESLLDANWRHFTHLAPGRVAGAISVEARRGANAYIAASKMASNAIRVVIMLGVALLVSWWLTLAAIGFGVVALILFKGLIERTRRLGNQQTEYVASLSAQIVDGIAGMKPIKAMGREASLARLLKADIDVLRVNMRKLMLLLSYIQQLTEPLTIIGVAVGIYLLLGSDVLALEQLIVLALAFTRSVAAITGIQGNYQTLVGHEAAFWFIEDLVSSADRAVELPGGSARPTLERAITFDDVHFAHDAKHVFTGVNLEVPARAWTVVEGPSGVGKTTLVDLMLGLYAPERGSVRIDGTDLREVDRQAWRSLVGYVPQEMFLFHDTVLANITLGSDRVSPADVERALVLAGADGFVARLEHGLDTLVGEKGSQLSGGQRQRIAIARALVHRPRLLILDEATASLDPATVDELCTMLRGLTEQLTIVAITHQADMSEFADLVIRLRHGGVIEAVEDTRQTAVPAPLDATGQLGGNAGL